MTERERIDQEIQKRHDWITAIHEAGHVLGCRIVGCPVVKATIESKRDWDGHVQHTALVGYKDGALVSLLGRAAEIEFGIPDNWGHMQDYDNADRDLRKSIRFDKSKAWSERTGIWGKLMGKKRTVYSHWDISPRWKYGADGKVIDFVRDWKRSVRVAKKDVQPIFDSLRRKARRLARKHRDYIEKVARLLVDKRTLTDEEIPQL